MSISLKQCVAELISQLVACEREIEMMRIILAEQPDFEPYAAFRRMDTEMKDCLSAVDMKRFIHREQSGFTDRDYVNLTRVWDSNGDGLVTYSDFLAAVLPRTSPALRAIATSRSQFLDEGLPEHVEYPLLRLFEKQMNVTVANDTAKVNLISLSGFSAMDAYETLDPSNLGYVSFEMLCSFFSALGFPDPDSLSDYTLHMFDLDRNGRFGYTHFLEGLSPIDEAARREATIRLQSYSPHRREPSGSRARSTPRRGQTPSPRKREKTGNRFAVSFLAPASASKYETPKKSLKSAISTKTSSVFLGESVRLRSTAKLNSRKMPKLAKILVEQLALEKELEAERQKLALRADFSVETMMKYVPGANAGVASIRSLEPFLAWLDIHPTARELLLLSHLLDKDSDGKVSSLDFSDLLVPRQAEHRRVLQSRPRFPSFSSETHLALTSLFRRVLDTELTAELIRERVSHQGVLNIAAAFEVLDRQGKGYVYVSDFRSFLQCHGHFLTEKELSGLMGRYDRDKDGKVKFKEFTEELAPVA